MAFKKINISKFTTIIGLLLVILGSVAYGSSREHLTEKNESVLKDTSIESNDITGDEIVNFGMGLLGTPYVTAGSSKNGFDCSGFIYFVFNHFKIQVPRSSSEFKNFGKEIPIASVRKGDILLFLSPTRNVIGHIGIVSNPNGMDSDFIHATSGRDMKVIVTSLKKPGYTRRFVKAIRVL